MAGVREIVVRLLLTARDAASGALDRVRAGAAGIGDAVGQTLAPLRAFYGLLTALAGVGAGKALAERADAYTRLTNAIRLATDGEAGYRAALDDVIGIAQRTRSDLETTATLYQRTSISAESLGLSQREAARLTELIAKGMQLGGASAKEYASATLQLTQAFNSGVFRGEEFNAVMEAAPALMARLAAGLGVTTGELRGLAEQGALTARAVSAALLSQADDIDRGFGKTTATLAQAAQDLNNSSILFVGTLDKQVGVAAKAAAALRLVADNLDLIAGVVGAGVAAATARLGQVLFGLASASLAARDAARQQAIAAAQQRDANIAAAQGQVTAAQAAYNRALAEQRAAQALIREIEAMFGAVAGERALGAARAQAAGAAAAATAATERYAAAQAALAAAQGPAVASAGLWARTLGFLLGPGGLILTAVASFGLLYAAFRDNKSGLDELNQSADQYAETLDKLNAAQLKARLLDVDKAIADQEAVLRRARFEAREFNDIYVESGEVFSASRVGTEEYTRAQAALADETAKLAELEAKRAALRARSATVPPELDAKALAATNARVLALDKLGSEQDEAAKIADKLAKAESQQIEAQLQRARAQRDLAAIEALSIQLARQKADAANEAAGAAEAEAVTARIKVQALEQVKAILGQLTPAEEKQLRAAQRAAELKQAEARAAGEVAVALATERDRLLETANLSPTLGAALDQLGVRHQAFAQRITETGQDIIAAFRQVTQNAQATAPQIAEAFQAAINGAKTRAEIEQIIDAYKRWAATAGAAAPKVSELLAGTTRRIEAQNAALAGTLAYEARINAVRYKNLSASERDAKVAGDAQTLIARATLERFNLSEKATEAEKKASEERRKALLSQADALASQVQDQGKAIRLLEDLKRESAKLAEETAERADLTAKVDADDKPARKAMREFIEWANAREIVLPVRLAPQGGAAGSSLNGLIDEIARNAGSQ